MRIRKHQAVENNNGYWSLMLLFLLGLATYIVFSPKVYLQCNLPKLTQKSEVDRDQYEIGDIYLGKDSKELTVMQLWKDNSEKYKLSDISNFVNALKSTTCVNERHWVTLWVDKSLEMGDVQDVCDELRKADARHIIYMSK